MSTLPRASWWTVRRASNTKPATYRCPICGLHLLASTEHLLIVPEGDSSRRRHAHSSCVAAARKSGAMVLRDEWMAAQPRGPSWWRRVLQRRRSDG
jgi:hypothetical protein